MLQSFEMGRHSAPASERCQEAVHRGPYDGRMVPQLSGLPEPFVDNRVERYQPANQLAPNRPSIRKVRSRLRQCIRKLAGNLGGNLRE